MPSRAQSALRRTESFSLLSSEIDCDKSGTAIPIISADSRRVETEDLRLWCELRLEEGGGASLRIAGVDLDAAKVNEDMDVFRECERA